MANYLWPAELAPYAQVFYLQPHTGGSVSPFSRQRKTYGLSAPLWMCRMSVRGGYAGALGLSAIGAAMDALLARIKGGQNRVGIFDFRRDAMRGMDAAGVGNVAGAIGDTTLDLTGLTPSDTLLAGDYIGGDGRPHILTEDAHVDGAGAVTVTFEPPLSAVVALDTVTLGAPVGWFRLASDDAGLNPTMFGELSNYELDFIEDPLNAPVLFAADETLTIGGITILIAYDEVEM